MVFGTTLIALLAVIAILLCSRYFIAPIPHPIARDRVERFAQRQSLEVTETGGPLLIRYLDTTRRWRAGGLLLSTVGSVLAPLLTSFLGPTGDPSGWSVSINFITLFTGWFIGGVIAEWFIGTDAPGTRRIASVRTRKLSDHLPASAWALPVAVWALLGLADMGGVTYLAAEHRSGLAGIIAWTLADIAVAIALTVVARRILARSQRGTSQDLIDMDNAIRSRSLHVIAGSSLAIGGYLLAGTVQVLMPYSTALEDTGSVVQAVCGLLLPILGYATATGTHTTNERAGGLNTRRPA